MDNKYTFEHIYGYLKNNVKIYILSLFFSVAIVFGLFLYSNHTEKQKIQDENNFENQTVFSFIIENEQGNIMNNSGALTRVFLTELTKTSFFGKDVENKFNVQYDDQSNSFHIFFNDNVKKSIVEETRTYLNSQMEQNKIKFFVNKKIYFINENVESDVTPTDTSMGKKVLILFAGLIIVLTLLFGTILANYFERKRKTISQKFYLSDSEMIIDVNSLVKQETIKKVTILNSLIKGNYNNKLIIIESHSDLKEKLSFDKTKAFIVSDLGNLESEFPIVPEEVFIICEQGETTKEWFNRQIELVQNSVNIVKVIYI